MISTIILEYDTYIEVRRYTPGEPVDLSLQPLSTHTTRGEANDAVIEVQQASIELRDPIVQGHLFSTHESEVRCYSENPPS